MGRVGEGSPFSSSVVGRVQTQAFKSGVGGWAVPLGSTTGILLATHRLQLCGKKGHTSVHCSEVTAPRRRLVRRVEASNTQAVLVASVFSHFENPLGREENSLLLGVGSLEPPEGGIGVGTGARLTGLLLALKALEDFFFTKSSPTHVQSR